MSNNGTVAQQSRVTVPSPGCLAAIMVPIVAVLITVSVLMVMHCRQERANERNKAEALERTADLAHSYARDMVVAPNGFPGQEVVRGAPRGTTAGFSLTRGREDSLTTIVRFFEEYEDTNMFGVSHSRAYHCYSIVLRKGADGAPQAKTSPLEECNVI